MDNPKTTLAKSKSSNSTSEPKKNTRKNNKTSRSNAEFQPSTALTMGTQPLMHRKRGVYVEKKPTKISLDNRELSPDGMKLPNKPVASSPRPIIPRPGKTRFLTSVLTILSKSTAGTQCPDEKTKKPEKTKKEKLKMRKDEEDIREEWDTSPNSIKRKPKFKSRILNNYAEKDSLVVLQSKKDVAQTSSNNSEYINVQSVSTIDQETLKWAQRLPQMDRESSASVATQSKKVRLIENDSELSTVIADIPKTDKKFYNFFVDMLQTTISAYNVETELINQQLPASAKSSEVALEMDECVARKLNIQRVEESPLNHVYSIMPDEKEEWNNNRQLFKHFQSSFYNSPPSSPKKKQKLKSESFQYKKPKGPLPKTTSVHAPIKKKSSKNDPKKDFLNLLKEELQMKINDYEEPENFYQALKVLAKNKRRTERREYDMPSDDHVCHFRPRRILSSKSNEKPNQSCYYSAPRSSRNPDRRSYKMRKIIQDQYEDETDSSEHSLKVVGYDYDKKAVKKAAKRSTSFLACPPTPPTAIEDFLMDYSDSDTSAMLEQRKYVLNKLREL